MFEQICGLKYLDRCAGIYKLLVEEQKQLESHDELLNTYQFYSMNY